MKRPLIIVLPVVVLIAGAALWFFVFSHPKHGGHAAAHAAAEHSVTVPLPEQTINLNGDDGFQYLQVQVALVTAGPMSEDKIKEIVEDKKPALEDAVNRAFEGQRFTMMRTPDGIQKVSTTLETELSDILAPAHVTRVYFEEFVAD